LKTKAIYYKNTCTLSLYFASILISCFLFSILAYGQQDEFIRSIFNKSDIKKLDKTKEYETEAEGLVEEANELYMETFAVQGNYELDEKTINKKVKQLESKAQKKQIEAATYYELIDQTKFGIYKTYIEKFWSDFEGNENDYINARLIEEQSNDYYFQAITLRAEAEKISDIKDKVEKLNSAHDFEVKALEKQLSALSIYYNIGYTAGETARETVPADIEYTETEPVQPPATYEEPAYQPTEAPAVTEPALAETVGAAQAKAQIEEDVLVNQMIINMYDQYMSDETRQPNNVLTPQMLSDVTYFDSDKILNMWYSYAYDTLYEGVPETAPELYAATDSLVEELALAKQEAAETGQEQLIPTEYEEKIATVEEDISDTYHIPEGDEIIYRVQIAAFKTQLTQRALSKIYYGNKQVEMLNEEGWFKYSIGDFYTYDDADKFRKQCGVKNAFIVAYRKGQKFVPGGISDIVSAQYAETATDLITSRYDVGLIFRVQVAANRVPLTREQLSRIYKDDYPVEMMYEDGWYKYQVLGVRLFSDALRILRNAQVRGAFIVAYDEGVKHNLYAAASRSKKIEKEVQTYGRKGRLNEIEWHVQIAASRIPLTQNQLSNIYSGDHNISLIIEEGWYKYRLKAGSSYSAAKEIKQSCNVPKAFIVAYYRAKKVPITKAINEL
jgi:hypothetical protein